MHKSETEYPIYSIVRKGKFAVSFRNGRKYSRVLWYQASKKIREKFKMSTFFQHPNKHSLRAVVPVISMLILSFHLMVRKLKIEQGKTLQDYWIGITW